MSILCLHEEWGCEGSGALSCWWKFALHFLAVFYILKNFFKQISC